MDTSPFSPFPTRKKGSCHAPYLVPQEAFCGHFEVYKPVLLGNADCEDIPQRILVLTRAKFEKSWMPRKCRHAFSISSFFRERL